MAREYATYGVGFQTEDVVPGEFLNNLDDLLYSYGDSALPTHTGTQVYVQATTGDEAQIAIDRRYFINEVDLYSDVVGDPDTYSMYGVASYIPTAHATAVKPFDIVVSTEPPAYEYVRELGTVEWSGTQIEAVWQTPHTLNVRQLDGYAASDDPADGAVVPVASSNSKLDSAFRPIFTGDVGLGDVIDYWLPPGAPFAVPTGYALCDGSVIPSGSHDLGAYDLNLPDLRDKFIAGADPSAPYGQDSVATDSPLGAPGVGGGVATHLGGYTGLLHDHTVPAHTHVATHRHAMASHFHRLPNHTHLASTLNWERGGGVNREIVVTSIMTTLGAIKTIPTSVGSYTNFTSWESPSTSSESGQTDPATMDVTDTRPEFVGFHRLMKVKVL